MKFIERSPRRRCSRFLESSAVVFATAGSPFGASHNKIPNKSAECFAIGVGALGSLVDKNPPRQAARGSAAISRGERGRRETGTRRSGKSRIASWNTATGVPWNMRCGPSVSVTRGMGQESRRYIHVSTLRESPEAPDDPKAPESRRHSRLNKIDVTLIGTYN